MASLQAARGLVRDAMAEGDHERALSLVERIRRRYPNDFETVELLGQIHLENGRYAAAREAFESVLEVDPENVVARSALAILAEEEGDPARALEQFERAFHVDDSNVGIAKEIQRLRVELGRDRAAARTSGYAVARRLFLEGKWEQAIPLFEIVLRSSEGAEVAVGMARALWLAGRRREAESAARLILGDHPNSLQPLGISAASAFGRGAAEWPSLLKRCAELNPGNPVARAIFAEAGLPFPAGAEAPEVPEVDREESPRALELSTPEGAEPYDASPEVATEEESPASTEDVPVASGTSPDAVSSDAAADVECPPGTELEETLRGLETATRAPEDWQTDQASAEPAAGEETEDSEGPPLRVAIAPEEERPRLEEGTPRPETEAVLEGDPPPEGIGQLELRGAEEGTEAPARPPLEFQREPGRVERKETGRMSSIGWRGDAALHISFGNSYRARGHFDLAMDEYRKALRVDASTAGMVRDAAEEIARVDPAGLRAPWLVGDTLAAEGQLRRAVEQYVATLKRRREPPEGSRPSQ